MLQLDNEVVQSADEGDQVKDWLIKCKVLAKCTQDSAWVGVCLHSFTNHSGVAHLPSTLVTQDLWWAGHFSQSERCVPPISAALPVMSSLPVPMGNFPPPPQEIRQEEFCLRWTWNHVLWFTISWSLSSVKDCQRSCCLQALVLFGSVLLLEDENDQYLDVSCWEFWVDICEEISRNSEGQWFLAWPGERSGCLWAEVIISR